MNSAQIRSVHECRKDIFHQKPQMPTFVSYSRRELLWLSRSPLVKVPDAMPTLKDWFGLVIHLFISLYILIYTLWRDWGDVNSSVGKKDSEYLSISVSTKEKRSYHECLSTGPILLSLKQVSPRNREWGWNYLFEVFLSKWHAFRISHRGPISSSTVAVAANG